MSFEVTEPQFMQGNCANLGVSTPESIFIEQ